MPYESLRMVPELALTDGLWTMVIPVVSIAASWSSQVGLSLFVYSHKRHLQRTRTSSFRELTHMYLNLISHKISIARIASHQNHYSGWWVRDKFLYHKNNGYIRNIYHKLNYTMSIIYCTLWLLPLKEEDLNAFFILSTNCTFVGLWWQIWEVLMVS